MPKNLPVQAEPFAVDGMGDLLRSIQLTKRNLNPNLNIKGILITMVDNRTNLSKKTIRDLHQSFGNHIKVFDDTITETMFMRSAILMSKYTGKTEGGIEIDAIWQMNDGLVNTISARAPFNATSIDYKEDMEIEPGIWYVLPTLKGDHMSLHGGMTKRVKVKEMYLDLVKRISELK